MGRIYEISHRVIMEGVLCGEFKVLQGKSWECVESVLGVCKARHGLFLQ